MRMKRVCLFFCLIVVLTQCSDEDPISTAVGLDYFPLRTGDSWIYEVQETTIVNSVYNLKKYELQVAVIDSMKNINGSYSYTLKREKRTLQTDSWQSFETWTAEVADNKLIQNENNVLFVKLVFPIGNGMKWNGNEFNNLPNHGNLFDNINGELYHVFGFDMPIPESTGLNFPKTTTIFQNDFSDNIVGKDQRIEIYARGVGLVYKEVTQLEYCSTPDCLGQQKVDKGFILVQTLKSHASQ